MALEGARTPCKIRGGWSCLVEVGGVVVVVVCVAVGDWCVIRGSLYLWFCGVGAGVGVCLSIADMSTHPWFKDVRD